MDHPVPEWLTNEFLGQSLRKEKANGNITVRNFTVSEAAPPGNNYGSFIVRVRAECEDKAAATEPTTISLIIKAELSQGPLKDLSTENEPLFYYKFIPAAKKFTNASFIAHCFPSPESNVTILEDLTDKGFVMCDRGKQLDFEHCRLYMKAAAELHAVSVAVYKEHPELLEPIRGNNLYTDQSPLKQCFKLMMRYGLLCLAEAVEDVEDFRKYSGLLRDLSSKIWDFVVEASQHCNVLKTIRQGDPWTANMMFKYNEQGDVCDIKIIDFQGTSYGSPAEDLVSFIWSSANNDVKIKRLPELYRVYVDVLNEKLKQFNCSERLTYEQLEEEVKRLSPMVLFTAGNLPALLASEPMDIGAFFSEEIDEARVINFYKKNYNENYSKNYLPHLLECLEANGIFDLLKNRLTQSEGL